MVELTKRDGLIVIGPRIKHLHKIMPEDDGRYRITASTIARKHETKQQVEGQCDDANVVALGSLETKAWDLMKSDISEKNNKPKKKTKKKSKKKAKKKSKEGNKIMKKNAIQRELYKLPQTLNTKKAKKLHSKLTIENREERPSNIMAELMSYKENLLVFDNTLFVYDNKNGAFAATDQGTACAKIRSMLCKNERRKVAPREIVEAYKMLMISEELKTSEKFSENIPYVNCLNGVFSVEDEKLLSHSPRWGFKNCIHANYDPDAKATYFPRFLEKVTNGDKSIERLLQEVTGYALSTYNNAKKAFIFYGPSNTGKSVMLNLIGTIAGVDNVCHVNLQQLDRQEYSVLLADKILNIAADLPTQPLRDIGTFKSLVSHNDVVSGRALYGQPRSIKGTCKMLFGSNHFLKILLDDPQDIVAFFNRIIYLPFLNVIEPDEDDKSYSDKLLAEVDFVFTWAMKGLRRYHKNGEKFTFCDQSDAVLNKHRARYNSAAAFVEDCLVKDNDAMCLTTDIDELFLDYCAENDISASTTEVRNYLEALGIQQRRTRGGHKNPRAHYLGIKIKDVKE